MLKKSDAEAAKTILQAAGWKDIAIYVASNYHCIQAMPPHKSYIERPSFHWMRDVIIAAQETPAQHHRYDLDAVIFKATHEEIYDNVSNLVDVSKDISEGITSWYSTLAKLLRQYADSPNVIRLIADNLDGKR